MVATQEPLTKSELVDVTGMSNEQFLSRLSQFAKVLSIALSEERGLKLDDEARKVDPGKLEFILRPLYITRRIST
jgi:hypothetical protein